MTQEAMALLNSMRNCNHANDVYSMYNTLDHIIVRSAHMTFHLIIFTLVLVKVITEFLFLVYISLRERVIKKFLDYGVLDDSLFSMEMIERQTLLALVLLPTLNFILSDLPACIATNASALIPYMLLLEIFMPMISYYIGEKLSKGIEKEQIKNIEYKEILVRTCSFRDWPEKWVRRRVPVVHLNKGSVSKAIRLILKIKMMSLLHLLSLFTCLALCYIALQQH